MPQRGRVILSADLLSAAAMPRKRTEITATYFAHLTSAPAYSVIRACKAGRFKGAYFDRTRWTWVIPCPVRLAKPR